jgi:hypothetical protein
MLKSYLIIALTLTIGSKAIAQSSFIRVDNAFFNRGDQPYMLELRETQTDNDYPFIDQSYIFSTNWEKNIDFEYTLIYGTKIRSIAVFDSLLHAENLLFPELLVDITKDSSLSYSKSWEAYNMYPEGSVFITLFDENRKAFKKYLVNGESYLKLLCKKFSLLKEENDQDSVKDFINEIGFMW